MDAEDGSWVLVEPPPQPTAVLRAKFDWRFIIPDLSSA